MNVYFIQCLSFVKIGKTIDNVKKRLSAIQGMNAYPVKLLHTTENYSEEYLHKLFKKYRHHGEWFCLCPEILQFIIDDFKPSKNDAILPEEIANIIHQSMTDFQNAEENYKRKFPELQEKFNSLAEQKQLKLIKSKINRITIDFERVSFDYVQKYNQLIITQYSDVTISNKCQLSMYYNKLELDFLEYLQNPSSHQQKIGYIGIRNSDCVRYMVDDIENYSPKFASECDVHENCSLRIEIFAHSLQIGYNTIQINGKINLCYNKKSLPCFNKYIEQIHIVGQGVRGDWGRDHGSGYYASRNANQVCDNLVSL